MTMYKFSSACISIAIHALVIALLVGTSALGGCFSRNKEIIPIDFTVAIESSPDADDQLEPPVEDEQPPEPAPLDEIAPPPPPPEPDPIPEVKKEKPREPEKKKEPEKKVEQKPKKPEIKKGRRIRGPENHPVEQTKLSAEEIARRLKEGARAGKTDSLEPGEEQKNFNKIQKALYDAWIQPPRTEAARCPVGTITFDKFGNITSRRLERSSGNAALDQSVIAAMGRVQRVNGLTARFLAQYTSISIDFEVK